MLSSKCRRISLLASHPKHSKKPPVILLAGDFNYPRVDWRCDSSATISDGQCLIDIINDFHLHQLASEPTRYSVNTASILDLVCCSHPSFISSLVVGREFSDHCLVCFSFDFNSTQADKPRRKILIYNKGNFDKICTDINQYSTVFFSNNPSQFSVEEN